MTKLLLSVQEASKELGLSTHQLYEYVESKYMPEKLYVRLGHRVFFKRAMLRQWAGVPDRKNGKEGKI